MLKDKNGNKLPNQKWYSATDSQVNKAVSLYLEEHPEALESLDRSAIFGINDFEVEYGTSQTGYKTDGTRVGWSNIYSTEKLDCSRMDEIICEGVGGLLVNSSTQFPSVIFFDENDAVVSYTLPDVQLSGTAYTFTGTIEVPSDAKTVAFNKIKTTDYESENIISWVQREINEEIKTVKELDSYVNSKINIKTVSFDNSVEILDGIPCVAEFEVSGDNAEIYVYGRNRFPKLPEQSFESNGITFAVDKYGKITMNGTATATSANGFFNWDSLFKYEPNTYYSLLKKSDDETATYSISLSGNGISIYQSHTRAHIASATLPTTIPSKGVSQSYIGLTNLTVGQVLDNVEVFVGIREGHYVGKHYLSKEPQKIEHASGDATYKIPIENGCQIGVISEGTTTVKLTYATPPNKFQEETEGGIVEQNVPNPDWWGWNLPDGDAFFRYNCNPNYWQQYKEVVGPMLVRGQLVVGKNKPSLGGNGYDSSVPARYGFHIFEGVGYEADGKRLTILGGKFKDTASMFYFKTPYDGDDKNLEGSDSYGWLQLGTDNGRLGFWVKEDNTRLHSPLVFDVRQNDVETTTETIEIDSKHYNAEVRAEEKYPVGTMYYNKTMGKVRVKTSSGWKSLAFED